jgi:hypothetical protein
VLVALALIAHVARETEHREFTYPELEELEQDPGQGEPLD